MMYTMPKNLLSICVNFALATQRSNFFAVLWQTQKRLPRQPFLAARQSSLIPSGGAAFPPRRPIQYSYGGIYSAACRHSW